MSITIYHKMWGMVSMKEEGMCLASVLLSNRLTFWSVHQSERPF